MLADLRDMLEQASRRVYTDHYVILRLPGSIKFFINITAVNTLFCNWHYVFISKQCNQLPDIMNQERAILAATKVCVESGDVR